METLELNPRHFRPGTKTYPREVNFFFDDGGMGDYICWMAAILFVAKECPHVIGHLYVPPYFKPLAENFLKPYPKWTVGQPGDTFNAALPDRRPVRQPINATGSNLLDLGFIYFGECNPAPSGTKYPAVDLSSVTSNLVPLGPYIVLTAGASFENRQMTPDAFNAVKDHIKKKGYTPVILGKTVMGKNDERKIQVHEGYDFTGTVNLINQTPDILEAAKIIDGAEMIVGLDNGLLHLAATTATPIVYGYTIALPEHREPKPLAGQPIVNLILDPSVLSCIGCQSQMRFLFNHEFSKCAYNDVLCTKFLTGPLWIKAVDALFDFLALKYGST